MAWDPYLDSIAGKCPNDNLKAIGIWGENGSRWASRGIELSVAECAAAYNADVSVCGSGLTLGGQKFAITRFDAEEGSMIGKGKADANSFGKGVIAIYKINTAFLFAIGDESAQGGNVSIAVGSIADYLKDNGYGL